MVLINDPRDEDRAKEIMMEGFRETPGMMWMLGKYNQNKEGLMRLTNYCLKESQHYKGAFISMDRNAVVFIFKVSAMKNSLSLMKEQINMFRITGIPNAIRALRLKRKINSIRPKDGLCAWLLARDLSINGNKSAYEVKREIFQWSDQLCMPIYAETTNSRIRNLYERIGFVEYFTLDHPYTNGEIHFMRRDHECSDLKGTLLTARKTSKH